MQFRIATLLIALTALVVSPMTVAQNMPTPPAAVAAEAKQVLVALDTNEGAITLALEVEKAPVTSANFLAYVDAKRLDGTTFYRAMNLGPDYGLVQAGTRYEAKRILPPVRHEPTSETGLSHVDGTISMARFAPGTATGDFFIIVGDMRGFDANPQATGDNAGFAAFGRVTEGMDIVRRILAAPTSPTEGEGFLKGQMLAAPLVITRARRLP